MLFESGAGERRYSSLEAHNGRQGVRSLPFLPSKLGIAKASFYEVILIFAKTEMRGRDKD